MTSFSWPVRVYWEDTDGGGIVYYANYLRFLERARTEWLRSLGFSQQRLAAESGIIFTVVNLSVEYRRPARLDDELDVRCEVHATGGASFRFDQWIYRGEELLLQAQVKVACVDARTMRPRRVPEQISKALSEA
ncbi:MAG TPA: tol-pal system-associated acyl-CoA thioesterase [Steroidobacteraceae bacterium]